MGSLPLLFLCCLQSLLSLTSSQETPPNLNGAYFRITAVQENGFLDIDDSDSSFRFYSYLPDLIQAIAKNANFTYDLLTPSGRGSRCDPPIVDSISNELYQRSDYDVSYRTQYTCGESDTVDIPRTNYSTDMYLGLFYVTPSRRLQNPFSLPFVPPYAGTLAMMGTATKILDFNDLVAKQERGEAPVACVPAATALATFLREAFPTINLLELDGGEDRVYRAIQSGTCLIYINDAPIVAQFVRRRQEANQCTNSKGQPIGTIGEPMAWGPSQYAIGFRQDIDPQVPFAISYWLSVMQTCNPLDETGPCTEGNSATFYANSGGTGKECGYVLFPPDPQDSLSTGAIIGIVLAACVVSIGLYACISHLRMLYLQRQFRHDNEEKVNQATRDREFQEHWKMIRGPLQSCRIALSHLEGLDQVRKPVQFCDVLIQKVLNAEPDATVQLKRVKVDSEIIAPMTDLLTLGSDGVQVESECPNDLYVHTDSSGLREIIMNAASAALAQLKLGVLVLRAEVKDDSVQILIEDSGSNLATAFMIEDEDDLLSSMLLMCKNRAESIGADLLMERSKNVEGVEGSFGTRTIIRLNQKPSKRRVNSLQHDTLSTSLNAEKKEVELPHGQQVLFCDGSAVIRKLFIQYMRILDTSWKIKEASDAETAIRLVHKHKYDLIFCDEALPSKTNMTGIQLAGVLRSEMFEGVICGLLAEQRSDNHASFLQAGANATIYKPFLSQRNTLKGELGRILDSKQGLSASERSSK